MIFLNGIRSSILFFCIFRLEPTPVPLLPTRSSKSNVLLSLFTGGLKTSTVITILIALLAALYVSAALMMIRIDRLHTAYLNHPLVSPERFTQDRLLHYLNTNLDQIVKVLKAKSLMKYNMVSLVQFRSSLYIQFHYHGIMVEFAFFNYYIII